MLIGRFLLTGGACTAVIGPQHDLLILINVFSSVLSPLVPDWLCALGIDDFSVIMSNHTGRSTLPSTPTCLERRIV